MESYEDDVPDSSDWEGVPWPDDWDDLTELEGWEVYDIDVHVDYGPE